MFDKEVLEQAKYLLNKEKYEEAGELLDKLIATFESEHADILQNTKEQAHFSFSHALEELLYRRVEDDNRELVIIEDPIDDMYSTHAFSLLMRARTDEGREALATAVRWNPMKCSYRFNLADVYLTTGNPKEYLGLSYSCFERAYTRPDLEHAYLNFVPYYLGAEKYELAAAVLHTAQKVGAPANKRMAQMTEAFHDKADSELLANMTDEKAEELMEPEGLPMGASAEVVIALLVMEEQAHEQNQPMAAVDFHNLAVALIGQPAVEALQEALNSVEGEA